MPLLDGSHRVLQRVGLQNTLVRAARLSTPGLTHSSTTVDVEWLDCFEIPDNTKGEKGDTGSSWHVRGKLDQAQDQG